MKYKILKELVNYKVGDIIESDSLTPEIITASLENGIIAEDVPVVDLEKERDIKCTAIARDILKEFSTTPINVEENHKILALKILSLMLNADLNITSEVSYVPQLLLGVLSGLNQTIQGCKILENDDARYDRITNQIITLVSNANIRMGKLTPEEVTTDFVTVKEELDKLFATEKLTRLEVKYLIDNLFESFTSINNLLSRSIESSTERMECKILGIESMGDLKLQKLDSVLKIQKV